MVLCLTTESLTVKHLRILSKRFAVEIKRLASSMQNPKPKPSSISPRVSIFCTLKTMIQRTQEQVR